MHFFFVYENRACEQCYASQLHFETFPLTTGAEAVEAQCKRFEVRASEDGRVLFSADEDEITIGAEKLKVTGTVIEVLECLPNKSIHNCIEDSLHDFWLPS